VGAGEAVEGRVVGALAEGEDAVVGPGSGFAGGEVGGGGETGLGADVVANLKGGEADVEGVGELEIGRGAGLRQAVFRAAAREEKRGHEETGGKDREAAIASPADGRRRRVIRVFGHEATPGCARGEM